MKGKILFLLVIIFLVGVIVYQKSEEKVDIAAEEEAIQAAIQKEMAAFSDMDYEGVAAIWAHEPYIYHASAGLAG